MQLFMYVFRTQNKNIPYETDDLRRRLNKSL